MDASDEHSNRFCKQERWTAEDGTRSLTSRALFGHVCKACREWLAEKFSKSPPKNRTDVN